MVGSAFSIDVTFSDIFFSATLSFSRLVTVLFFCSISVTVGTNVFNTIGLKPVRLIMASPYLTRRDRSIIPRSFWYFSSSLCAKSTGLNDLILELTFLARFFAAEVVLARAFMSWR
uniref:Uncharacterized protein n=1 Tax=Cacopsylla melanoneura TaxID=428564 RepID=A0A8D8TGP9_9HEMI